MLELRNSLAVPNGGPLDTVCTLGRPDLQAIIAFVLALDAQTRDARFGPAATPATIRAHYAQLDWAATAVFGWFEGATLRAVAEAQAADAASGREPALAITADPHMRGDPALDLLLICALPTANGAARSALVAHRRAERRLPRPRALIIATDNAPTTLH